MFSYILFSNLLDQSAMLSFMVPSRRDPAHAPAYSRGLGKPTRSNHDRKTLSTRTLVAPAALRGSAAEPSSKAMPRDPRRPGSKKAGA